MGTKHNLKPCPISNFISNFVLFLFFILHVHLPLIYFLVVRDLFYQGTSSPFLRREYLRSKIDWPSRIVGSKFTVFALFYFVFEGNFPSTSPPGGGGGLYLEGWFNEGVFALPDRGGLYLEGLNFGILRYPPNGELARWLRACWL